MVKEMVSPTSALAPIFIGDGKIEFAERPVRAPGVGELLLRVEANAICGTDREQYTQGSEVVPGHEAAGVIVAAGPGTSVTEGTRGAVYLMDYCGTCRSCRLSHTNQCFSKRNDMGFTADGGYGPYEVIHETNFFPVPDSISASEATLLLDVMGTGGHAIRRMLQARADTESLFIAGAGPIGLGVLAMAKIHFGEATPVYISDVSAWRRDFAANLGGIPVDALDASAMAALPPVDAAVDSTGKQVAREAALRATGKRGVLACVGHGEGLSVTVSPDLIAPERAIMGSEYFRFDEMSENLELLLKHRELLAKIITHEFPVAEIADAFKLFLSGQTGKVIVVQDS